MSLTAVLYTLSSVPIFASRPFLAAFATALVARFGPELPWIGDSAIVAALHAGPAWFQSTVALVVLGLLAALELLAARSGEARALLDEIDGVVKAVVSALVAFTVIDADTARTIESIQKAGVSLDSVWAVLVGGATFAVAGLRAGAVRWVTDLDEGDDLGLVSLFAWAESTWAVIGILFLLVFPVVALALAGLTVLGIAWARRRAARLEERAKTPCAACGTPVLPHASACPACGRERDAPRAVGVLGQPLERPAPDRERHQLELVSRKRCPRCATRLSKRAVRQTCPACRRVTFANAAELERYLRLIRRRLPRALLVSFLLGAIPLLGVIPGVLYYRLNLVSGLRGYLPPLRGFTARWLARLMQVGLLALQPIPLLGAVALPLLCWSTYAVYRRALGVRAEEELAAISLAVAAESRS